MRKILSALAMLFCFGLCCAEGLYVCMGSFSSEKNADKFKSDLGDAGLGAFVEPVFSGGKKVFRVYLSEPAANMREADEKIGKLKTHPFVKKQGLSGLWASELPGARESGVIRLVPASSSAPRDELLNQAKDAKKKTESIVDLFKDSPSTEELFGKPAKQAFTPVALDGTSVVLEDKELVEKVCAELAGTAWYEQKFERNWIFPANRELAVCVLQDARSGQIIRLFKESDVQRLTKVIVRRGVYNEKGGDDSSINVVAAINFDCAETNSQYSFIVPIVRAAVLSTVADTSKTCSKCGTEHDSSAKYCRWCGASFELIELYCMKCGSQFVRGEAVCSKCGEPARYSRSAKPEIWLSVYDTSSYKRYTSKLVDVTARASLSLK